MNPLMLNAYYSQLIEISKMLMTEEDSKILDEMVKDFEDWISDDLNKMTL